MGYSIKQLFSFHLSLLLLSHEVIQAEEITGTVGQEVKLNFTWQAVSKNTARTVSLYKDGKKIGECPHTYTNCICRRGLLTKNSQGAIVSISNLTMADSGNYSITVFNSPFFQESKLVSLVVSFEELATDSPPPYRSNGNDFQEASSASFLYVYIIIIALGFISVMLPSVLLSCFYQTPKRSSGRQQRPCSSNELQVPSEAGMPVYPMEYVALDFPNSLNINKKAKWSQKAVKLQETVEYATITFPQG